VNEWSKEVNNTLKAQWQAFAAQQKMVNSSRHISSFSQNVLQLVFPLLFA
jgi:hypothetical protein